MSRVVATQACGRTLQQQSVISAGARQYHRPQCGFQLQPPV